MEASFQVSGIKPWQLVRCKNRVAFDPHSFPWLVLASWMFIYLFRSCLQILSSRRYFQFKFSNTFILSLSWYRYFVSLKFIGYFIRFVFLSYLPTCVKLSKYKLKLTLNVYNSIFNFIVANMSTMIEVANETKRNFSCFWYHY